MGEIDVKNTIEQFFKEGFRRGFEAGDSGSFGHRCPEPEITWNGLQPVIRLPRPKIWIAGQN